MPSMKGLSMNRMIGTIKKRTGTGLGGSSSSNNDPSVVPPNETVEANAVRSLRQFCESGGPNKQGDEVLYLPPIVDGAESSPVAAAECARQIRKYLTRENKAKASWQYNAIMVMRILTDNPGKGFTKNIDKKFVDAVKETLRANRDPSVQQILMETLDDFERSKADHEGLAELIGMWKAEKEHAWRKLPPQQMQPPPWQNHQQQSQNYFARDHSNRRLPNPVELASRLEEARTSAKLLSQVVLNTPAEELLNNDLVKEFADRCHSASKSMQLYMLAENPAPDNDTMESIIDTNEQLQSALNQHQRAVLTARKKLGLNVTSEHNSPTVMSPAAQPPVPDNRPPPPQQQQQQFQQTPPPQQGGPPAPQAPSTNSFSRLFSRKPTNKSNESERFEPPPGPPPGPPPKQQVLPPPAAAAAPTQQDDPFRDPEAAPPPPQKLPPSIPPSTDEQRLAYEPYHPGFQPTSSYLNRQDSAADHTTMRGGAASSTPGGLNTRNLQNNDDAYGADDLYESSPNRKEPPQRL